MRRADRTAFGHPMQWRGNPGMGYLRNATDGLGQELDDHDDDHGDDHRHVTRKTALIQGPDSTV
jgi:hypothetical protein